MARSLSLLLYEANTRLRGQVRRETAITKPPRSFPGQVAWLHVEREEDKEAILEFTSHLWDRCPDLFVLFTSPFPWREEELPDQAMHQFLDSDDQELSRVILANWAPVLSIWATGKLFPGIMHEISVREVPLILLDTGSAFFTSRGWPLLPGLVRSTLRKFSLILSGDEATTLALISAGAQRDAIHTIGVMEMQSRAPVCNHAEWEALIGTFSTRPVWLAADICAQEIPTILKAHSRILRHVHRLLLIVVPNDLSDTGAIMDLLDKQQITFARRSAGKEPDSQTQVYLADTQGELGLWYRLAPITFVGGTLNESRHQGPNPFEPASLGSVVLHGPQKRQHKIAYERLARAGASREVSDTQELALALDSVMSLERAAMMAYSAWQICSAGAEVMEAAVERIAAELERIQQGAAR